MTITYRQFAALALSTTLTLAAAGAQAQAWSLVTKAESDAEQAHLQQSVLLPKASSAGAPQIEIVEPDLRAQLAAPLVIRVKFVPEGAATVVPASLRVYYGVFGIDITDRLMKRAHFEHDMLVLDRADIPAGTHRLLLTIKDSTDRTAEKLLTFTVR